MNILSNQKFDRDFLSLTHGLCIIRFYLEQERMGDLYNTMNMNCKGNVTLLVFNKEEMRNKD